MAKKKTGNTAERLKQKALLKREKEQKKIRELEQELEDQEDLEEDQEVLKEWLASQQEDMAEQIWKDVLEENKKMNQNQNLTSTQTPMTSESPITETGTAVDVKFQKIPPTEIEIHLPSEVRDEEPVFEIHLVRGVIEDANIPDESMEDAIQFLDKENFYAILIKKHTWTNHEYWGVMACLMACLTFLMGMYLGWQI